MNLPNKLTVIRMIMIVPFVLLMLGGYHQWGWLQACLGSAAAYVDYISLAIFVIASLTDLLDGKIARKYNLVTNFGKFMDPLADKLLVCAAMICLIEMGRMPAWIVIVIAAAIVLAMVVAVTVVILRRKTAGKAENAEEKSQETDSE